MSQFLEIKENILKAKEEVVRLNPRALILGATKTQSKEVVDFVLKENLLPCVGENRAQEFTQKYDAAYAGRQHFIGRVQSNKVKYLVGKAGIIFGLDGLGLAEEINCRAQKQNVTQTCFIQINVGEEEAKGGIAANALDGFYGSLSNYGNIAIGGITAVMPQADTKTLIALYKKLAAVHARITENFKADMQLCAGMSVDFKIAIEYGGANIVRLGSLLFGERNNG
jgi:uncharacterized pyridoxal phosphate-containing UPF0001 family protein